MGSTAGGGAGLLCTHGSVSIIPSQNRQASTDTLYNGSPEPEPGAQWALTMGTEDGAVKAAATVHEIRTIRHSDPTCLTTAPTPRRQTRPSAALLTRLVLKASCVPKNQSQAPLLCRKLRTAARLLPSGLGRHLESRTPHLQLSMDHGAQWGTKCNLSRSWGQPRQGHQVSLRLPACCPGSQLRHHCNRMAGAAPGLLWTLPPRSFSHSRVCFAAR